MSTTRYTGYCYFHPYSLSSSSDFPLKTPKTAPNPTITLHLQQRICRNSIIMASFAAFDLRAELVARLKSLHYASPSPTQAQLLPPLLKGRDLMAQARAGSGKTLAVVLAALNRINVDDISPQALILAPTHELAIQISEEINQMGHTMRTTCIACYGGSSVRRDIAALQQGVHIVVGTVGRLYDLISNDRLETDKLKLMVIDDADMLSSKRIRGQFNYIINSMPKCTQMAFISTTFPEHFKKFALSKLIDPVKIVENPANLCPRNVSQYFLPIGREEDRLPAFIALLNKLRSKKVLVFCKAEFKDIKDQMGLKGMEVLCHHSQMEQPTREKVVSAFRKKSSKVMISSGLLARGLDIPDIEVVVMYDLPSTVEYVHSIGRCGRFGRKGVAVSLANQAQGRFLANVERKHRVKIGELTKELAEFQ
jgi:translation initiation factor 4A